MILNYFGKFVLCKMIRILIIINTVTSLATVANSGSNTKSSTFQHMRANQTVLLPSKPISCVLPQYPEHGTYRVANEPAARPGQSFESVVLTIACRRGFGVVSADDEANQHQIYCVNGKWFQEMPKCVRFCKLDPDPSVRYMCHVPGTGFKACNSYVPPGTTVNPVCNKPLYQSGENHRYMKCVAGYWDTVVKCAAECGRITAEGNQLVLNGVSAKRGELPWHTAIYQKTDKAYKQICGGSIISNNVVISAAHCFWSDVRKHLPASQYAVAAGKLYRGWNNTEDIGAQKSDVREIKIPTLFKGEATNFQEDIAIVVLETPFIYKTYLRPVCLNFDANFDRWQLQQGKPGKVAGWGLTNTGAYSQVLQVVDLPYISIDICIETLPPSFTEYITVDKFCAGYTNGTSLCKGDSGGGLAFADKEIGVYRYYLRGVVSTAPNDEEKICRDDTYTAFTRVSKHEEFIKESLAASVNKTCPPYQFQCDDGACADQGADCNGILDCKDGSDETDKLCDAAANIMAESPNPVCVLPPYPDHGEYSIADLPHALPGQFIETVTLKVRCHEGYGILESDGGMDENGIQEVNCTGGKWDRSIPNCVRFCKLEPDRSIRFMCLTTKGKFQPCNTYMAPSKSVIPICNNFYYTIELLKDMNCVDGGWDYVAKCKTDYCKLEPVYEVTYKCGNASCSNFVPSGTSVTPSCNSHYYSSEPLKTMTCAAGSWDYMPMCIADCGRGTTEVLKGENDHYQKRGNIPWHVTIYTKTVELYGYICGGVLVSNAVVISTAHCFLDARKKMLPANELAASAGQYYRLWNHKKDIDAQRSDVKDLIPVNPQQSRSYLEDMSVLLLETPFLYNSYIRPACLSFDRDIEKEQLVEGNKGMTGGFSQTSANSPLSIVRINVSYHDMEKCRNTISEDLRLYALDDKICTEYNGGGEGYLLNTNYGIGLMFTHFDAGVERQYLRGVLSNGCLDIYRCMANPFGFFTKISKYETFIRQYI